MVSCMWHLLELHRFPYEFACGDILATSQRRLVSHSHSSQHIRTVFINNRDAFPSMHQSTQSTQGISCRAAAAVGVSVPICAAESLVSPHPQAFAHWRARRRRDVGSLQLWHDASQCAATRSCGSTTLTQFPNSKHMNVCGCCPGCLSVQGFQASRQG